MANVPSPSTKSRDFHGEQQMGFYWGEQGYFFVDGPSGDKGHRANASGARTSAGGAGAAGAPVG